MLKEHLKNLIDFKQWKVKDSYFNDIKIGRGWFLKKFIVLYKIFYVDKNPINDDRINSVLNNFTKFINNLPNEAKSQALEYFKIDLLSSAQLIPFNSFNDLEEYTSDARKFYFLRLFGGGGQSGIKKRIQLLVNSNKKFSYIFKQIPIIKKEEILRAKKEGKKPRSVEDSIKTIITDYPASLRNFRQILTYWGFLPPENDGYKLNQISNLIFNSDDEDFILSIFQHQKIKLRMSNPNLELLNRYHKELEEETSENISNDYFKDFFTNPFISLIKSIQFSNKIKSAFSIDDYKFLLSRISPYKESYFNSLKLNSITNEKECFDRFKLKPNFTKKRRSFRSTNPSKNEGILKDFKMFLYGLIKSGNSKIYGQFLELKNDNEITIIETKQFNDFNRLLLLIEKYLLSSYEDLYNLISYDFSKRTIDSYLLKNKEHISNEKKEKLLSFTKKYHINKKSNLHIDEAWQFYFTYIDHKVLIPIIYFYSLKDRKLNSISDLSKIISNYLSNLDENYISNFLNLIRDYLDNKKNIEIKILKFLNQDNNFNELASNFSSNSSLQSMFSKIYQNQMIIANKSRSRDVKVMNSARKKRLDNIFHGIKSNNFKSDHCDLCDKKSDLDCHHILPFEYGGPDHEYNYVFLCKDCHDSFTYQSLNNDLNDYITLLRIRNILNIENIKYLIDYSFIDLHHLKYFYNLNYIHLVEYLECKKFYYQKSTSLEQDIFIKSKLGISNKRWSRAMKEVFNQRINFSIIMGKEDFNYNINNCDGGCGQNLLLVTPECHHLIPKKKKFKRHGDIPLNGPESPFNFFYLCKECHLSFTLDDIKSQTLIIENFRNNNLINKDTISNLVSKDFLTNSQLKFLYDDKYINESEYLHGKQLIDEREKYLI